MLSTDVPFVRIRLWCWKLLRFWLADASLCAGCEDAWMHRILILRVLRLWLLDICISNHSECFDSYVVVIGFEDGKSWRYRPLMLRVSHFWLLDDCKNIQWLDISFAVAAHNVFAALVIFTTFCRAVMTILGLSPLHHITGCQLRVFTSCKNVYARVFISVYIWLYLELFLVPESLLWGPRLFSSWVQAVKTPSTPWPGSTCLEGRVQWNIPQRCRTGV